MGRLLGAVAVVSALLLSGCGTTAPTPLFSGGWKADYKVPGSSLILDLTQTASSISGVGSYTIEAGRAGAVKLSGTASGSSITLNLTYDFGSQATFQGNLATPTTMVGTIQYTNDTPSPLSFTKTQ